MSSCRPRVKTIIFHSDKRSKRIYSNEKCPKGKRKLICLPWEAADTEEKGVGFGVKFVRSSDPGFATYQLSDFVQTN